MSAPITVVAGAAPGGSKTLLQQLRDSRALYEAELARYEELSDEELARVVGIASGGTIDRVLGIASDSTIDRVLGIASDSTIARVLGIASGGTIARVLGIASDSTIDRVLGIASGGTIARVLDLASSGTIDRVLDLASGGTIDRVLGIASGGTIARLNISVPVVAGLDALVAQSVEQCGLYMSSWHCGTTHCRGGWAITHAGAAGAALEAAVGPEAAARLIYEASTGRVAPNFYASPEEALADILRCAEVVA